MSADPIYDETQVPSYTLPDPLVFKNGSPVTTPAEWEKRREELLRLFESHVYGKTPVGRPTEMRFESRKKVNGFLGGLATLEEIRIHFSPAAEEPFLDLLVIKPSQIPETGAPTFLALNFNGNHSIHPSPEITLSGSWMRTSEEDVKNGLIDDNRATENSRGSKSSRWPVEKLIKSGTALATFYYGDIDPDFDDGFKNGIHALFGQPAADEWGSIGAWAWGASRAMDFLTTDKDIDKERVAIFGHSRLGKTALWAGARDQRFSLVISNNSGCGGAALSRRCFGERVGRINTAFPHWFSDAFLQYNENEAALPVDQHQLIALIAPRRVYVASAVEDEWADPRGEFLAAKHAGPVYELLGKKGLGVCDLPGLNTPVGDTVRYHIRAGKHDVTDFDWEEYIKAIKSIAAARR
ncbi:MAG: acetylxylan esterase [Luteolibacter sp.]|nr:acetylxylan esterase [Luteolibacter sp.]